MKKTAIFVEGKTEQIFVVALIQFFAQQIPYRIEVERHGGGGRKSREAYVMRISEHGAPADEEPPFYFLVIDCSNDEKVPTLLSDQYEGLVKAGYSEVVAIRDVFPQPREKQEAIVAAGLAVMPTSPICPLYIVAIMEVEAWFLAEATHFPRIDATLTRENILKQTDIDIEANAEDRDHPSEDLNRIYQLAGTVYEKNRDLIDRTVGALDMKEYLGAARARSPRVGLLLDRITAIFTLPVLE